ncbi:unnamed protein product [Urochloa decumbens]|uniref:Disease resistance protein At4g27190-like leucine-rich repeats domain-containing protein n=1 Tax=Urochloa decumbens TaxID=240449 RepID=A0ABC9BR02_9POAL
MPLQEVRLRADNTDSAAEEIIAFLGSTRQESVIYFDGWYRGGLGASAILKAVVERFRSSSLGAATRKAVGGLDKIIHIDCSLWQSKRSLQKAIGEELKLPKKVMDFFNHCDDEDDFDGLKQADRGVILEVKWVIFSELSNCKFLVVFHNGSGNYVDLWECGVPVMGPMNKRVLWTSRGKFRLHGIQNIEDVKAFAGLSDMAMSFGPRIKVDEKDAVKDFFRHFLHAEAGEVASRYNGVPDDTKIVLECILYKVMIQKDNDINWGTHAANYWVCDGIIHEANGCGRSAWEIGDALHRTMNLDWHQGDVEFFRNFLCEEQWAHSDRWVSATGQDTTAIQALTTSFFWTGAIIQGGTFKDFDKSRLHVLHLSHCTFSFSSPPFISCSYLRFLLLDHCKDKNDAPDHSEEQDHNQVTDGACFQKLWVLELSYTDWYWLVSKKMLDLMVELRELNVKGSSNWSISHLHSSSDARSNNSKLLKLRVVGAKDNNNIGNSSGYRNQQASSFPDLSSWHILKTVILDGCGELEEIGCNTLSPSLESFSFTTSNVTTKIKRISFRGCSILKSLMMRGLFGELVELNMSGTSVKTLDLSETQALRLKRLFLLGCEKLCVILWPQEGSMELITLEVLHIDTTHSARARKGKCSKQEATSDGTSAESSSMVVHRNGQALTNLALYISLRDPRLFRSLLHTRIAAYLHIEITSTSSHRGSGQGVNNVASSGSEQEVRAMNFQISAGNLYIEDIISTFEDNSQTVGANEGIIFIDAPAIKWMWPCPPIPMHSNCARCYISIQDETPTRSLQDTTSTRQQTSTTLPSFLYKNAKILHLHDSLSITCIPGPSTVAAVDLRWDELQWCQLERCPNLEGSVFTPPSIRETSYFGYLETFWASQLLKARYIWGWSALFFLRGYDSFEGLVFLHLDWCPRLLHVLPLYTSNGNGCRSLETIEIICCGELREVFPSDSEFQQQQKPREFPSLKRIHLYELPMLQRICGRRIFAPRLETVKIRGCWSLKHLPAVCRAPHRSTESDDEEESSESDKEEAHMLPTVDCEKDWWDNLEWDGKEAGHHPSHYKPTHSAYYKKTLLRATVLR